MCVFRLLSHSSSTKNRCDGILCVKLVSLRILRKTLSATQTCTGILEFLDEQLLSWGVMSSEVHDVCWWTRLSSRAREQECLDRVERPWVFCRGPQTNTINPGCQHSEWPSLSSSHKTNARWPSCRAIYASLTESLEVVTREACWGRNVGARRAWGME